jgi:hypothetical protein
MPGDDAVDEASAHGRDAVGLDRPAFSTFREPDGQITARSGELPVQPPFAKIFLFFRNANQAI